MRSAKPKPRSVLRFGSPPLRYFGRQLLIRRNVRLGRLRRSLSKRARGLPVNIPFILWASREVYGIVKLILEALNNEQYLVALRRLNELKTRIEAEKVAKDRLRKRDMQ